MHTEQKTGMLTRCAMMKLSILTCSQLNFYDAERRGGPRKKSSPEKIPARICFQKGESCCSSREFGLGTLMNSSMSTNPRKAAEIQNFGCGEAEVSFRSAEEGIYFGDRDHAAGRTLE